LLIIFFEIIDIDKKVYCLIGKMVLIDKNIEIRFVNRWPKDDIVDLYKAGGWWKETYDPSNIKNLIKGSYAFAVVINIKGNKAIGKALGVIIPDLGSKEVQALDDSALKKAVVEGKGKMQAVNLSDEEADDVIAFMRSLKKPSPK